MAEEGRRNLEAGQRTVGRHIVDFVLEVERSFVVALVGQVFLELVAFLQAAFHLVAFREHLQEEPVHCHLVTQSA